MNLRSLVTATFLVSVLMSATSNAQVSEGVVTTQTIVLDADGKPARDENGDILFATIQVGGNLFFSPGLNISAGVGVQLPNEVIQAEGFVGTQLGFDSAQLDVGYRVRLQVYTGKTVKTYVEWEEADVISHGKYYADPTNTFSVVFQDREDSNMLAKVGLAETSCFNSWEEAASRTNGRKCRYLRASIVRKFK